MPFMDVSVGGSVNVLGTYKVTLEYLPDVVVQGDKVTFKGKVTYEGSPAANTKVEIRVYVPEVAAWEKVAEGTTNSSGEFSIPWDVPYGWGCRQWIFRAYHPDSGAWSDSRAMSIAYRTSLSLSLPSQVRKGEEFTVSGYLEYYESPSTGWKPLANRTVKIYVDGSLVKSVTTGSDGRFSAKLTINTPGTHTIRAVFEGEFPGYAMPAAAPPRSRLGAAVGSAAPMALGLLLTLI